MAKNKLESFLETITDEDIKSTGLVFLTKEIGKDETDRFIQFVDEARIFDDSEFTCHYEILFMGSDTPNLGGHRKGNIYVEIHFESRKYSPYFSSTVMELAENSDLETFYWRDFCPGLRMKNAVFTSGQKTEIIKNLKHLRELTIDKLLQIYKDTVIANREIKPGFALESGKECNEKRSLSEFHREPKEIYSIHEIIKKNLLKKIEKNPGLLDKKDPIDTTRIAVENLVNNVNYIDLVAETVSRKRIFFEIKTASEVRLCIRQALGQLMEYAFYAGEEYAQKLVIVGPEDKTPEDEKYLQRLNNEIIPSIPIQYICIKP